MFYYEETLGKTLEKIDEVFDGVSLDHTNVNVYEEFLKI